MTRRVTHDVLVARNEIAAPPAPRACDDRSFELPGGLYVAMGGLLFSYLAVMTVGFANPGLAVPMAVNFIFLTAFFAVPAVFVASSHEGSKALGWSEFLRRGVETEAGHASGSEAAVLTLLLPALILFWAVAVVVIAALV